MIQIKDALFEAFREDHAMLGKGLYALRNALAAGDANSAKNSAQKIDRYAGAHIAFEEQDFYPALAPFLSQEEIAEMYREHAGGLALIRTLLNSSVLELSDAARQLALVTQIKKMEAHVSECGELFGAMGGLSNEEQTALMEKLNYWRNKAPRWTEIGEKPPTPGL